MMQERSERWRRPHKLVYDIDGPVMLEGYGKEPVQVCEIVNGNPQVVLYVWGNTAKFVIRYAGARKIVKRYDLRTFREK
ncbi:MAG: UDP-N-acetylmuramoyl-tripeptide--D-alanyl-D-alanine ligase [Oscillospiraceae bacterium]|nr:UDP-N-acetylmuramoyl-tripeptide--D-alanyl-D-alanine ligase [Oscillospiraceae bacterium]